MAICFKLFMQLMRRARSFAFESAGSNIDAKMAMIAITTNSSISVNPWRAPRFLRPRLFRGVTPKDKQGTELMLLNMTILFLYDTRSITARAENWFYYQTTPESVISTM